MDDKPKADGYVIGNDGRVVPQSLLNEARKVLSFDPPAPVSDLDCIVDRQIAKIAKIKRVKGVKQG